MSPTPRFDAFGALSALPTPNGPHHIYRLDRLASEVATPLDRLPFSIKVLLEAALRSCDGYQVTEDDVRRLASWNPSRPVDVEIPFKPARVILQDFTGVPCVVDLAAMRDAVKRLGGDPRQINPLVPVDLVIDHSVQVDVFGNVLALERNAEIEFARNRERYEFLRWGQHAFSNFRVVPPATGIVHQVNLEYLAGGVLTRKVGDLSVAFPDTLVGTDSHTTMINGLGVLGWGVGGIEAEAVMLGQPLYLVLPQVVGFKLTGSLREGVTATDLVLTVTQMLRKKGVVDKFVEFYGPGLSAMSVADRATIGNMAPEYGATIGFFPVDRETLRYLERTNRSEAAALVEAYCRAQGLFRTDESPDPLFTDTLALDLGDVEPSLAGPKRPQDRVPLRDMQPSFRRSLTAPVKERGYGMPESEVGKRVEVGTNGDRAVLQHGSVVIAAITSCTNTSNPSVMVAAGLVARNAAARGLKPRPHVKTSMAPGSKVVTRYLREAGLLDDLEALGFNVVGYGCTTCIAAGTPILQADGTALRIEDLPTEGGARLFAPGADGTLRLAVQTERMVQGIRDCVSLVLQDGRKLVCTPDHEILCADGRWVRADRLELEKDRVVIGLEAPLDHPAADEAGYRLQAGDMMLTMESPQARQRALAFARLVGHLLADGSIAVGGQGRMNVGQAVDRDVVLDDIERITGKRPIGSRYDERKWSIVLPKELTAAISMMPGVRVGRRIDQPATLPAFVLDWSCPVAMVREFLGGLFGADGWAPTLHRFSAREEGAALGHPAFSETAKPEQVGNLREVMADLIRLLERCGVKTAGVRIYEYPTRRSATSYPAALDGSPRVEVRLQLPDGLSFVERVGFRYCVDKSMRASAAAVYWRTIDTINEQRLWMSSRLEARQQEDAGLSFPRARQEAATALLERETALPSPVELFRQIGARDWFARLGTRDQTDTAKRYCVEKDSLALPTLALQVLDRRPAGQREVFDLTVEGQHAFVAGTVAVHNCIGNSGPLPAPIAEGITSGNLVAASVLSGNRNFEGRINPLTRANYLASPPLVVAYALAGTVDIDLQRDPLGHDAAGHPVYLHDLWPTQAEIAEIIAAALKPSQFQEEYANVFSGNPRWNEIPIAGGELYGWSPDSTYIHEPPFFQNLPVEPTPVQDITSARVLVMVGDSVTTDHISPAGDIADDSPAGRWLKSRGITKRDFNSYGSRRGNDLVMVRGTFANIRLKNLLVPSSEGNVTLHLPSGESTSVFDAAERYRAEGTPLLVLAGKEYGAGSSRDWAAKGTLLLGVRAVLAESYERIHRSNLVGMGVLPLQYETGQYADGLGLNGREGFDVVGLAGALQPRMRVTLHARRENGSVLTFHAIARLDTPVEVDYYRNGGILPTVLRNLMRR
ncbi:MAG TPA: aconitate hydratase AcnA [Candidatus Limnocylindria bacterium]|nr:aconitate hydratase AcnA [Candidatus Limnocylindria bacterium]